MTNLPERGLITAKAMPGVLELLKGDELDGDQPQLAALAPSAVSRGRGLDELKRRWRAILSSLSGYKAADVLLSAEPIWIPIIELYVPPGGKSTLKYQRTSSKKAEAELKIFGIGFGSGAAITFSESLKFDAAQTGKSLQVMMSVSAMRYTHPTKKSLIRVDVKSPRDTVEYKVVDLPPANDIVDVDNLDPLDWEVIRRLNLSSSSDRGSYTWQYQTGESSNWKVSIGLDVLKSIGLDPKLDLELEQAREFEVTFEMPYGHDYVFYGRTGELPLVPFCALGRIGG